MSPTVTTSDLSLAVLTELVAAAASAFPADGLVAGPADVQDEASELLPAEDALVLVVPLDGSPDHRLVAVVSPGLLTAMGLPDADGLADAMGPVLSALAGDGAPSTADAKLGIGLVGLADVPGAASGQGALIAAGLFLGSDHVATLGISITASSESDGDASDATPQPASAMDLPDVAPTRTRSSADASGTGRSLDLLRNVEMNVTAELGRAKMTVADLLSLTPGSVVELDRTAGTPIDVMVNGTLIARGEVVVIDEEFGVRISEIVDRIDGV